MKMSTTTIYYFIAIASEMFAMCNFEHFYKHILAIEIMGFFLIGFRSFDIIGTPLKELIKKHHIKKEKS